MNRNDLLVISEALSFAGKRMANNICNDLPDDIFKDWSFKEKDKLVKDFEKFNSEGKDYKKGDFHCLNYDWIVMFIFSNLIKEKQTLSFKEKVLISHLLNIAGNDFAYRRGNMIIPITIWNVIEENTYEEKKRIENNISIRYKEMSSYFASLLFYYSDIVANRAEKINDIINNL